MRNVRVRLIRKEANKIQRENFYQENLKTIERRLRKAYNAKN